MESDLKTDPMHDSIVVRSTDLDIGENVRTHAPKAVLRTVEKYSESIRAAAIHFSRERRVYQCTIKIQTADSGVLISEASGVSVSEVFATALRKTGKQIRRRRRALETDRAAPPPTQTPSSVSA
jgi:ribosomal subunit interface protein